MSAQSYERTNSAIALVGMALILVVFPLSPLLTAAVVLTMVGVVVTYLLTTNPVRMTRPDRKRRRPTRPFSRH